MGGSAKAAKSSSGNQYNHLRKTLAQRNSVGSAPNSPERQSKEAPELTGSLTTLDRRAVDAEYEDEDSPPPSNLGFTRSKTSLDFGGRFSMRAKKKSAPPVGTLSRKVSLASDALQGSPLQVCTDCKEMILQVIRAQTTAHRLAMTRNLLNDMSINAKEEVF